jgi:small-conductance mechanosensitive channel
MESAMIGWGHLKSGLYTLSALAAAFLIAGGMIAVAYWLLLGRRKTREQSRLFPRQIALLLVVLFSIVGVILVLPVSDSARNQLIGLLGILLSGMVAFSSSTAMTNLLAGFLLRLTKPFRIGDFIRVGDHFGRVSELGLFDTEIQGETRELIAIPNAYLIRTPVSTTHSKGAIISATLSLGYDIDHSRIETLLCEAAEQSGLTDPFVHIIQLGDFSVTYRISGLLEEVKGMITANSRLYAAILDTLHRENIEIMSPSVMNQRRISDNQKIIPPTITGDVNSGIATAEEIIFDKAEQAEQQETEKQTLQKRIETLEQASKTADPTEKKKLKEQIQSIEDHLKTLQNTPVDDASTQQD